MRVAVLQSNYLPWKGYFDLIRKSDAFVFYDDVQFTKNDWRNRNLIKTPRGTEWISVPVGANIHRLIQEVPIESSSWQFSHWGKIKANYLHAPYFKEYADFFEEIYRKNTWTMLSDLNQTTIERISREILNISKVKFFRSSDYELRGTRQERLLGLLKKVGATHYISGPSGANYIEPEVFVSHGVTLEYIDYSKYPVYPQLYPPFSHGVSILDLIFNCGPNSFASF